MTKVTWAELTEREQQALRDVRDGKTVSTGADNRIHLQDYGLIWHILSADKYTYDEVLTDLGRAVLAQAKPTTITAADFVRDGYAAKIAAGECVVATNYDQKIRNLTKRSDETHHMIWPLIDSQVAGFLEPDDSLTVTWLPQADAKPDSGATWTENAHVEAEYQGIHSMWLAERERNEALQAELASAKAENKRLRAALELVGKISRIWTDQYEDTWCANMLHEYSIEAREIMQAAALQARTEGG